MLEVENSVKLQSRNCKKLCVNYRIWICKWGKHRVTPAQHCMHRSEDCVLDLSCYTNFTNGQSYLFKSQIIKQLLHPFRYLTTVLILTTLSFIIYNTNLNRICINAASNPNIYHQTCCLTTFPTRTNNPHATAWAPNSGVCTHKNLNLKHCLWFRILKNHFDSW